MSRPATSPFAFATDTNYTAPGEPYDATPTKVSPTYAASGFLPGYRPPAQHFNYMLANYADWLAWFEDYDTALDYQGSNTFAGDTVWTGDHAFFGDFTVDSSNQVVLAYFDGSVNGIDFDLRDVDIRALGTVTLSGTFTAGVTPPVFDTAATISASRQWLINGELFGSAGGSIEGSFDGTPVWNELHTFDAGLELSGGTSLSVASGLANLEDTWQLTGTLTETSGGKLRLETHQITSTSTSYTIDISDGSVQWVNTTTLGDPTTWTLPSTGVSDGMILALYSQDATYTITLSGVGAGVGTVTLGGSAASGTRIGIIFVRIGGVWYPFGEMARV